MRVNVRQLAVVLVVAVTNLRCGTAGTEHPAQRLAGSKIGFIFVGARDDLGYNQAAWEASDTVARAFPDHQVLRQERVPETAAAERAMDRMIAAGARIIFATSFGHLPSAARVARRHPEVVVVHQGGVEPRPGLANLGTFFGTVYEPVYLAGIAAGAATRSGLLGFVAAFPIPATFNNINAFTLGAQSVNPAVRTRAIFTSAWCDLRRQAQAAKELLDAGADVLTQHQDCTRTVLRAATGAGAASVGYHYDGSESAGKGWLTGAVWDWGPLYVDIVKTVLSGRFRTSQYNGDFRGSLRSADNPFVLAEPGPSVTPATRELMDAARARFASGGCPFDGPVVDRDGVTRVRAGHSQAQSVIDRMDYLVAGVDGAVPAGFARTEPRRTTGEPVRRD